MLERMINMSGEVHINDTLCKDTSGEGQMFRAHTSELLRAGRFVAGWITLVGLRTMRFIELGYERGCS